MHVHIVMSQKRVISEESQNVHCSTSGAQVRGQIPYWTANAYAPASALPVQTSTILGQRAGSL